MAVKARGAKESKKKTPDVEVWMTNRDGAAVVHLKGCNGKQYGLMTIDNSGVRLHADNSPACGVAVDAQGKIKVR